MRMNCVQMGSKLIGPGNPCWIVAELGINHNGSLDLAKELVDAAVEAKCDAVKLQKRTPELAVPQRIKPLPKETPWGAMTYLEYRKRLEFGRDELFDFDRYCAARGIPWFASPWDVPSLELLEEFNPPAYKIASACVTDSSLLRAIRSAGRTAICSTGMSTMEQIRKAVSVLGTERLVLCHSTSAYPASPSELNLKMIATLRSEFGVPVGYSGHETGIHLTLAAVAMGACLVERHLTLDQSMWGTDQAASLEPQSFAQLVSEIRMLESAIGDGVKRIYESEMPSIIRLRKHEN